MSSQLPLRKNFGDELYKQSPVLSRQLDDMYTVLANALANAVRKNIISGANPPATDQSNASFGIGDITIRTDTDSAWILTSRTTSESVVWTLIT